MTSEKIKQWLSDSSYKPLFLNTDTSYRVYMRIPKNDNFDYLYGMSSFYSDSIKRNEQFYYKGIYSKIDGLIYDSNGEFRILAPELEYPQRLSEMADEVSKAVGKLIEERLADDCSNLDIHELTDDSCIKSVDDYRKYSAESDARKSYIFGDDASSISFKCLYDFDGWNENNLLTYLSDKDSFIHTEAEKYWNEKQEYMLTQFMKHDLLKAELERIESLGDSTIDRIRKIRQAVELSFAKSVTVTVCKDGEEMSFRTDTSELKDDPGSYYSTWHIAAPDREKFKQMFGRSADYTPDEIINIEYRGKSIYSAEPLIPEDSEEETEGMTMTM